MATTVTQVHGQLTVVDVVRESSKTVWVRLRNGQVIKRHRVKHMVGTVSMEESS
jgi:hypothetical protein